MTTAVMDTPDGALTLSRPGGGDASLRAWDAADELLLAEAHQRLAMLPSPRVLIIDDQFGALTLGLRAFNPDLVADSATLPAAVVHNAGLNSAVDAPSTVFSWLNPPQGEYDVVILRVPRQAEYLAWQLRWINGVLAEDGVLLTGGMIKHLPDRGVEVFAQAVPTEAVLPARKKARVVVCRRGTAALDSWPGSWKSYTVDGSKVQASALPAVFAREKLDIGTRLFLPHVKTAVSALAANARVLDLPVAMVWLGLWRWSNGRIWM